MFWQFSKSNNGNTYISYNANSVLPHYDNTDNSPVGSEDSRSSKMFWATGKICSGNFANQIMATLTFHTAQFQCYHIMTTQITHLWVLKTTGHPRCFGLPAKFALAILQSDIARIFAIDPVLILKGTRKRALSIGQNRSAKRKKNTFKSWDYSFILLSNLFWLICFGFFLSNYIFC